jgi:hypothetical protein
MKYRETYLWDALSSNWLRMSMASLHLPAKAYVASPGSVPGFLYGGDFA